MPEDAASGADVTFASLGVPAPMVEVLEEDGITVPFPIQAATLTDALAGRDILGRARTGSGKTLGFSLPLVARLAGGQTRGGQPRGLVLVPTRELAHQVQEVLRPLARAMGLWVTTIYGGVSYGPQITALQKRTDIVVATPGRLADLISQGECDLAEVEVTVIDEADQMADLGFLPIVRRLLESTREGGQRMLFSATLDSAVDVVARRFLADPALHSVDEHSSPAEIEHHVLTIAPADRVGVVTALAGGEKRSLVFTRTKHGAERLARQLTEAGIPAAELHGNLRQGARSRNLAAFASGLARVMVATDIAARGIHIDGIDLVIHADPPMEHKAYVHRSGRTARGGADGVVVTLQTRSQSKDVTLMMKKAGIAPHDAVAVDPESAAIREIAGDPATRVQVGGKVAELVRAEDRLGERGAGRPGGQRGDRRRRGERGDRDFGGRALGRARRDERPARAEDRDRPARAEDRERPARFERGDRFERAPRFGDRERGGRFGDRDRFGGGARPAYGERDDRFRRDDERRDDRFRRDDERQDRVERTARFGRDDRPARRDGGRDDRPARSGPGQHDRFDRAPRNGWDDRYRRDDRGDRQDRGLGGRGAGDRGAGDRGAGDRGAGGRGFTGQQGRSDAPGRDREANDWWPRSGGGRTAGSGWRPGGQRNPGNRAVPGRGARPEAGGGSRGGRPRSGYSSGPGAAGNRRDSGRGRQF